LDWIREKHSTMASDLDKVLARVKQVRGIDLGGYRQPMLERRLAARMRKLGVSDPAAYLRRLETDPSECDRLVDTIAINVSSFFRNPFVFEIIHKRILPDIIERKRGQPSREIRVWSAGCGAGEEAYSIAIILHAAIKGEAADWTPRIFATDIDGEALKAAAVGAYPRDSFQTTKLGILDKYFTPNGTGFEVRPFVRKMVRFSHHDLTSPKSGAPAESVFGTFDLVLCRNVLIYFSRKVQEKVLDKLYRSVARGGYLILGESELPDGKALPNLVAVDRRNRIFRRPPR